MTVRLLVGMAGNYETFKAGDEVEFSKATAERLIETGQAEKVARRGRPTTSDKRSAKPSDEDE